MTQELRSPGQAAQQQRPDESEKLTFVSGFLDHFVNVSPVTVEPESTLALNEMTNTLRQQVLVHLNQQHFAGKRGAPATT